MKAIRITGATNTIGSISIGQLACRERRKSTAIGMVIKQASARAPNHAIRRLAKAVSFRVVGMGDEINFDYATNGQGILVPHYWLQSFHLH
jgi:hypothetical protein